MAAARCSSEDSCDFGFECTSKSDAYKRCCDGKCVTRRFCDGFCTTNSHCGPNENCDLKHSKCYSTSTTPTTSTCKYPHHCSGSYKNCCSNKCVYHRYCDSHCSKPSDCAADEYCIYTRCTKKHLKPEGYCDTSEIHKCPQYNQYCGQNNKCEYCDCAKGEKCGYDGKCQKKDPTSFSPASIAGLAAVVVIGSCIACGIYCGCARRVGRQPARAQVPAPTTRQDIALNDVHLAETGETPSSPPVLPGGPPPYESLERLDVIEEPPPPTYEEAVRNSHKNVSVI